MMLQKAAFVQLNGLTMDPIGRPALVNALGALDVDIILEEGPDVASLGQEAFDVLKGYPPGTFPPQVLIELAPWPREIKNRILQMMAPKPPNPAQQIAAKVQLEGAVTKNAKTAADARYSDARGAESHASRPARPPARRSSRASPSRRKSGKRRWVLHAASAATATDATGRAARRSPPCRECDHEENPRRPWRSSMAWWRECACSGRRSFMGYARRGDCQRRNGNVPQQPRGLAIPIGANCVPAGTVTPSNTSAAPLYEQAVLGTTNGWTPKALNALAASAIAIKASAGQLGMMQC